MKRTIDCIKDGVARGVQVLAAALVSLGCGGDASWEESVSTTTARLGSTEPVTMIYNLSQLRSMSTTGNYRLANNINASSTATTPFVPIGSVFNPFTGTFDGNGYTINNLHIDSGWYSGLFSSVYQGILRRVALTNVNVSGYSFTGAIAGVLIDSELTESYVTGTVTGNEAAPIGMAVGTIGSSARVNRCYATGTLTGTGGVVGGFAGRIDATGFPSVYHDPRAYVEEVFTNVNVNPNTSSGTVIAGGLAGTIKGAVVRDINVVGPVVGRVYVGGVVGYAYNSTTSTPANILEETLKRGIVTNAATPNRSGMVGGADAIFLRCTYNFWDTSTDGGVAPPLAPGEDTGCQVGYSASELRAPRPAPGKLIAPFHRGALVTQQMVDEGERAACALGSGTDGDWGFGTCGTTQVWALNNQNEHITLTRIPNPGVQPR